MRFSKWKYLSPLISLYFLFFWTVRFPEDLENDIRTFFPEYTHQLFGDDETAFGYKGLKILLYYIADSLSTMFRVEYASKVDENFV